MKIKWSNCTHEKDYKILFSLKLHFINIFLNSKKQIIEYTSERKNKFLELENIYNLDT